jgi:hypothetical protein
MRIVCEAKLAIRALSVSLSHPGLGPAITESSLVNLESATSRFSPIKEPGSFQALAPKLRLETRIINHLLNPSSDGIDIKWIDKQARIAHHLWQAGPVSYYYRRTTLHCFKRR